MFPGGEVDPKDILVETNNGEVDFFRKDTSGNYVKIANLSRVTFNPEIDEIGEVKLRMKASVKADHAINLTIDQRLPSEYVYRLADELRALESEQTKKNGENN